MISEAGTKVASKRPRKADLPALTLAVLHERQLHQLVLHEGGPHQLHTHPNHQVSITHISDPASAGVERACERVPPW